VTAVRPMLYAVKDEVSPFVIEFYPVDTTGEPIAHEHSDIAWSTMEDLRELALAPADEAFVRWLADTRKL